MSSFTPRIPTGSVRPKSSNWVEGDIAYLKDLAYYTWDEYDQITLKTGNKIPEGASNHPVIILKKGKRTNMGQFYLVTTVSAYSSSYDNGYLAPWKQGVHSSKTPKDFRSFAGSELYQPGCKAALQLKPGQSMPKPKTSWVYAQHAYVVPEYLLGAFNKSPYQLEMKTESLVDLNSHMKQSCSHFQKKLVDHRISVPAPVAITPSPKVVAPASTKALSWAAAPIKPTSPKVAASAPLPKKITVAIQAKTGLRSPARSSDATKQT
ncbi:hypothetical protein F5X68DRAFT_193933 [Plectosphaerella plurivora]|uniref:Uncharacterized protein n=1 Tax=Plectosphaerella plurivora TaxID=936078 RepID=A0A9P8V4I0_9PEZI|nr:hypothetical protein F5X68DRAFT_193933 [Plectosphaerella plurivora]